MLKYYGGSEIQNKIFKNGYTEEKNTFDTWIYCIRSFFFQKILFSRWEAGEG